MKQLGFRWVTLDDGWQTAEGDWFLDKTKFPNGDGDMKSMVDRIHQDGFKAQLWWSPMSVDPEPNYKKHPEWLILDAMAPATRFPTGMRFISVRLFRRYDRMRPSWRQSLFATGDTMVSNWTASL